MNKDLFLDALSLLKELIATPSFSGEEEETCSIIEGWLNDRNIKTEQIGNNIVAYNAHFDAEKPSVLLNSHHDTVTPNSNYTKDPFFPEESDGKLFGLGSNDAGGCLVALMALFSHFYDKPNLEYNLILAATGEEESSGDYGIKMVLPHLPKIDFALVGEPTEMNLAIAEKGLLVIDATAQGKAGHAAHGNTVNPILGALEDIQWISNYEFPKVSDFLGKVKMTVTQINAGAQHNVVPGSCDFVIDIRVNDQYSNRDVFAIVDAHTKSTLKPRSFNLNSSSISKAHPIVINGQALGMETYGSPTLSDQCALSCPSLKCGPGSSLRSHMADEFIYVNEIKEGIEKYITLFETLLITNAS